MLDQNFYSNGKLLLTAEYVVLDGAKALALPVKFGQDLDVKKISNPQLIWESFDEKNYRWFSCTFNLPDFTIENSSNNENLKMAITLQRILKEAQNLNTNVLSINQGFHIKTNLSFPINWGLGTSSTLINNIAQWFKVDAFELLKNSFGGSGYDIACAQNSMPITYQINNGIPNVQQVNFDPNFKDQLYFVHLNRKQNSNEGITRYKNLNKNKHAFADDVSDLTNATLNCSSLFEFENILIEHERIIGTITQQKPIQQDFFSDYFGQTKSLGAWGGDFILATGNESTPTYFKNKGFGTIITYSNMILCNKK